MKRALLLSSVLAVVLLAGCGTTSEGRTTLFGLTLPQIGQGVKDAGGLAASAGIPWAPLIKLAGSGIIILGGGVAGYKSLKNAPDGTMFGPIFKGSA